MKRIPGQTFVKLCNDQTINKNPEITNLLMLDHVNAKDNEKMFFKEKGDSITRNKRDYLENGNIIYDETRN